MKVNIAGKIRDIKLAGTRALLPLFEAVVNSIQAIEEAKIPNGRILIRVRCQKTLLSQEDRETSEVVGFEVEDNGIGFTQANFDSFDEEYTDHKASRGGKGLGRFCWLCVFNDVEVDSAFCENGRRQTRSFSFSVRSDDPVQPRDSRFGDRQSNVTVVHLKNIRKVRGGQGGQNEDKYASLRSMKAMTMARRIIEHCLEYFVGPSCPQITIDDPRIDGDLCLNTVFESEITDKSKTVEVDVGGSTFTVLHVRLQTGYASDHQVHYCGNGRVVKSEKLEKRIPNLRASICDQAGERFTYAAYVESGLLDETVSSDRTTFALSEDDQDLFAGDITWQDIRAKVVDASKDYLKPYIEPIQAQKAQRVSAFVKTRPRYRPMLKYAESILEDIAPDIDDDKLESRLYEAYCQVEKDLIEEGQRLFARKLEDADVREYEASFQQYFDKANDLNQSDLARYVCHRRSILEFLKKLLKLRENGKYHVEESLHNALFPMGRTLDDAPESSHNLWVLDEKLVYHEYLASDKQLRTTVSGTVSQVEPDILASCLYDTPNSFGIPDESPLRAVVIVEFKRPMRTSYPDKKSPEQDDENPFTQVFGYIDKINESRAVSTSGRPISVSPGTPFYCYIVADLTPQLQRRARAASLTPCPEGPALGFLGFNPSFNAYIEVISYDKMISDATKRNTAFFDKLNMPAI
jgi:hypothetical protein